MTYRPFVEDQKSAFDEVLVANLTPVVQIQFPYNINSELVEVRENISGTVTQANSLATMRSGAAANSAAHMLSHNTLDYRPGEGGLVRFTAIFTTGVTGSVQVAGIGEVGDGLFFGYNGDSFGILRRSLGVFEIQTLSVDSAANLTGGNVTINLDSQATVVALALNDTTREIAVKIADADYSDSGLGWSANVDNATVVFRAWSDDDKTGTFSMVDTDSTGATGTFSETVSGVDTTEVWIPQASWNLDAMDGTGPSGITLDPTMGNVYQIRYQWLGFGAITFSIEDPETGGLIDVHRIQYSNANTVPSLQNPTLPLHIMAKNNSNTSDLAVSTSSMAAFVEGKTEDLGLVDAADGSNSSVGTTELPILSIKNKIVYAGISNRERIRPLLLSLATEGTKPIIFRVWTNATLTGPVAFTDVSDDSPVSVDIAATGIDTTNGVKVLSLVLGKTDSELLPFVRILEDVGPGEILTITAEATSGSNHEADASITWEELL